MTTLQMQNTSQSDSSATADPMDLISDADRGFGASEEIDIDLDFAEENESNEEDDLMVEDGNSMIGQEQNSGLDLHVGYDDEMADGEYLEELAVFQSSNRKNSIEDTDYVQLDTYEDTNVDDVPERLYDSSSKAIKEGYLAEAIKADDQDPFKVIVDKSPLQEESFSQYDHENDPAGEDTEKTSDDARKDLANIDQHGSASMEKNGLHQSPIDTAKIQIDPSTIDRGILNTTSQEISFKANEQQGEGDASTHGHIEEKAASDAITSASRTESSQERVPDKNYPDRTSTLDKSDESTAQEVPDSKDSTYLHPVMIMYQDNEISLFPPLDQEASHDSTYFLQDERVAGDSISNLLGACRSVLGDSINSDEELMIDIEELGLHIAEFATESSTVTLAEIIDIYVNLQHYDGQDDPPALYMKLTTKPSFSHRFEYLLTAVAEEKGLSQVQFFDSNAENPAELGAGFAPDVQEAYDVEPASHGDVETSRHPLLASREELYPASVTLDTAKAPITPINPSPNHETVTEAAEVTTDSTTEDQRHRNARSNSSIPLESTLTDEVEDTSNGFIQSGGLTRSSSPNPTQPESQVQSSFITDYGGFIDDIDYKDLPRGTSSGSSTLQGDRLDLPSDGHVNTFVEESLPDDTRELSYLPTESGGVEIEQRSQDNPPDLPTATSQEAPSGNTLDAGLNYTEYSQEEFDTESKGQDEIQHSLYDADVGGEREERSLQQIHHDATLQEKTSEGNFHEPPLLHENVESDQKTQSSMGDDLSKGVAPSSQTTKDAHQSRSDQGNDHIDGSHRREWRTNLASSETSPLDQAEDLLISSMTRSGTNLHSKEMLSPQISANVADQAQEDDDEITYEDEENEEERFSGSLSTGNTFGLSPPSHKRGRTLEEGNGSLEVEKGVKRVRSR